MAALDPRFRGSTEEHQVDVNKLRRSIRGVHLDIWETLIDPVNAMVFAGSALALGVLMPSLLPYTLLACTGILLASDLANRRQHLDLRLPRADCPDRLDWGDPKPGRKAVNKARGVFLFGWTFKGRRELWGATSDILTHMLVLGGTGAGKTETLVSMAYNALALGSGYAYVDPKASPKLFAQNWIMTRSLGRDDDLRVLNFAVGDEKLDASPRWRSNSMQPFALGKSEKLKEIPLSLMAGAGSQGSSGNEIFSSNGKTLMTALVMALTDLRDAGVIPFSVNDLRNFINPDRFIELVTNNDYRKHLSPATIEAMESFLTSMGWDRNEKDKSKWGDFSRQYSYAQNYFLEPLSTMADTYRHIFNVRVGEINMVDVILQRRAFITLLPSLEKSKKEAKSLGQITLAQIRIATAVGLGGGDIMGSYEQVVTQSSTKAEFAFQIIIDEFAAISVDGFAEVFTQGRGLFISATAASQDWAGFKKANEAEAQQILANAKFKFIMTGDDPNDTKKLILDLAGEAEEIRTSGYQLKGLINYMDNLSASAQRVSRVDMRDIAAQIEGEWHLFFKDKIIRGYGFHAGAEPPEGKDIPLFVHHMLMIEPPEEMYFQMKFGSLGQLLDRIIGNRFEVEPFDLSKTPQGFMPIAQVFDLSQKAQQRDPKLRWSLREIASVALAAWMHQNPPFSARQWLGVEESAITPEDKPSSEPTGQIIEPASQGEKESSLLDVPLTSLGQDDLPPMASMDDDLPVEEETEEDDANDFDDDFDLPAARHALQRAMTAIVAKSHTLGQTLDDITRIGQAAQAQATTAQEIKDALSQATHSVLTEPSYPQPPKPQPSDLPRYRSKLSRWIEDLKKDQAE